MTPQDVAADRQLFDRFLSTVPGYVRPHTGRREFGQHPVLLPVPERILITAWLWPDRSYNPAFDPFDPADERNSPDAQVIHERVADVFFVFLEAAADECGRAIEEVLAHVRWSARLSERELDQLLNGHDHIAFIVQLCGALQLEFNSDHWILVDPPRLARRVTQSLLATQIAQQLHHLTTENLESVRRKLPKGSEDAARALEIGAFPAPSEGSRYRTLYEALAADERPTPRYSLKEIDGILAAGGEPVLPRSAHTDRSWWAGSGTKATGRPQISAWWAAGYQILQIEADPASGAISSVSFEALPGRAGWIADPERTQEGVYRMPAPSTVRIELPEHLSKSTGPVITFQPTDKFLQLDARRSKPSTHLNVSQPEIQVQYSDDVAWLRSVLEEEGEADRSLIEQRFRQDRHEEFEAAWMTNLLTRARRQGQTKRYGTRNRPRWVATGSKGDLMLEIADVLGFESPYVGAGAEVPIEYLRLVTEALGLRLPTDLTTGTQIAQHIVESLGLEWEPAYERMLLFPSRPFSLLVIRNALRDASEQTSQSAVHTK